MSAKGRKRADAPRTEVAEHEFYPTPRDTIEMLIASPLLTLPGGLWLDPCAGTGRIPSVTNSMRSDVRWLMVEIDRRHKRQLNSIARRNDLVVISDFMAHPSTRCEVLIMNPPFSLALEFAAKALRSASHIVMLQRLNWLAPARANWLREHMPDTYVLPRRPSFTGDGSTDATEYAWFHWPTADVRRAGRVAMLDAAPLQADMFGGAA